MDLTHRFSVPATREEAWTAFAHLDRLAPCFPGATITSIDGDDFAGTVKVKLGPIALVYTGTGRYAERDAHSSRMVIEARGRDKRGNGTATATVAATFTANGDQTDVEVQTDLSITGKPAQFGRGVISDVSDKLLAQFVSCVSDRFVAGLGEPEPDTPDPATPEPTTPEPTTEDSGTEDLGTEASDAALTQPSVELGESPGEVEDTSPDVEPEPDAAAAPVAAAPPRPSYTPPTSSAQPDFNVVSTVLPVLLKRYWPVLGGAAAAALVVRLVLRRAKR